MVPDNESALDAYENNLQRIERLHKRQQQEWEEVELRDLSFYKEADDEH